MKLAFLALAILAASSANAEIYKWTDADGRTHYSDEAPKNSQAERIGAASLPHVHKQEAVTPFRATPQQGGRVLEVTEAPPRVSLAECKQVKRRAVMAEKRSRKGAPQLDSWLWKNCRAYSNELRKVSQSMM